MNDRVRTYGAVGLSILLVVGGSLMTGILPATPLYQSLAGIVIVAGFGVGYVALGEFELPE